ncbi:toxin glutamine deamidase domain-containing protein [Microbispora sp. NBRC 16548]|uniref:toxin glutamine deamidase domain-containing protein n=1 Tax=Microbispora sp. NBRC 16548 TaxID=3030994 RepID=UPI0025534F6C|nr:toxin glutamine deamidase domain-containing protein [Microbispora sp. NBRC 16548]
MNQERARRHARWRLPSGVYNPVVSADGRRWRDYEQAAEAPAPSLEDRRLEVRLAALPLGVDTVTMPVVPAARNGEIGGRGGHGLGAPGGRRAGSPDPREAGSPDPREAVPAATPADAGNTRNTGDPEDAEDSEGFGDLEDAGEAPEAAEEVTGEVTEEAAAEDTTGEAAGGTAADAAPDGSPSPEESGSGEPGSPDPGPCDAGPGESGSPDSGDLAHMETRPAAGIEAADTEADVEADIEADAGADEAEPGDHLEIAVVGTRDGAAVDETSTAVASVEGDRPGEPLPEPLPEQLSGAGHDAGAQTGQGEWLAETAPAPRITAQADRAEAEAGRSGHPNGTDAGAGQGRPPGETAPAAAFGAAGTGRDERHEETPGAAVDDGPETGDFADADDFWSAVLHDETERDWLDGPGRPRRLEETRPYGRPGGLAEADPDGQVSLVQAVSGRFPDPRGTWIRLINAEGPTEDAFRSNNAVDCALSVMSTWHGEPVVAARRQPEYDGSGRPLLTGETGGVARAEEWLGHRFEYVGHGRRAYVAIAQRLIFGGHGAAAVLITRWAGGGSHAWNAVNCRGEVLWIDAQRGHMAVEPPYEDVTGVFAVVIDRQGRRL